jgi:hypothetical protein
VEDLFCFLGPADCVFVSTKFLSIEADLSLGSAGACFAMIVCMAKSYALTFMGDDEGALRLCDHLMELDGR